MHLRTELHRQMKAMLQLSSSLLPAESAKSCMPWQLINMILKRSTWEPISFSINSSNCLAGRILSHVKMARRPRRRDWRTKTAFIDDFMGAETYNLLER